LKEYVILCSRNPQFMDIDPDPDIDYEPEERKSPTMGNHFQSVSKSFVCFVSESVPVRACGLV
jgi:hypothetical protein